MHDHLLIEFDLVKTEITLVLDLSAACFAFPVMLICKYIFALKTDKKFFITVSDFLDVLAFLLTVWVWERVAYYEQKELEFEIFGPDEDGD